MVLRDARLSLARIMPIFAARKMTVFMKELTLTTPTLLFSAVSLILLAYTNRF